MNRREFTKSCVSCLAVPILAPILHGCQSAYYTTGTLERNGISLSRSHFVYAKKSKSAVRNYLIVKNDALEFPIYVYRFSDTEYSAVLMQCTHQGNELQASGDHLHCPAHGSEFNNKGVVEQGPAENNLRSFKVTANHDNIFIDLTT